MPPSSCLKGLKYLKVSKIADPRHRRYVDALKRTSLLCETPQLNIVNTWQRGKQKVSKALTNVDSSLLHSKCAYTQQLMSTFEIQTSNSAYNDAVEGMTEARNAWSSLPPPERGAVLRSMSETLREHKEDLATLITVEVGKIHRESLGEVQEAIDICDHAAGLSRTMSGSVIPSERSGHILLERYHPMIGHLGIITAFNFPLAVYFWNTALSLATGNAQIWKPSPRTPSVALAATCLVQGALERHGISPALAPTIIGGSEDAKRISSDPRIELVSFTGSTEIGKTVARSVSQRLGRHLLELGGNNAGVVLPDADLDVTVPAVVFSAVGTAGQRCTTMRRLFVHSDIYDQTMSRIRKAYSQLRVGDPFNSQVHVGPVQNDDLRAVYEARIVEAQQEGYTVWTPDDTGSTDASSMPVKDRKGKKEKSTKDFETSDPQTCVTPAIVECPPGSCTDEHFVPILYVSKVNSLEEAIRENNATPHGLSSSLFTKDIGAALAWTDGSGSDCGIVNVNIGTSGAEIGGAFGGNKDTGWGRESGSDVWKQYTRRSTITMNSLNSEKTQLAQGIEFF